MVSLWNKNNEMIHKVLSDSVHMFIKPQKLCISIVLQGIGLRKLQNRKEQTFI